MHFPLQEIVKEGKTSWSRCSDFQDRMPSSRTPHGVFKLKEALPFVINKLRLNNFNWNNNNNYFYLCVLRVFTGNGQILIREITCFPYIREELQTDRCVCVCIVVKYKSKNYIRSQTRFFSNADGRRGQQKSWQRHRNTAFTKYKSIKWICLNETFNG